MTGTMTCRDGVRILMDYTEGVLPETMRHAVEAHVGGCRRCQGFLHSYGETPRIVRRATDTRMPAEVGRRLGRIIAALPGRGSHRQE